jgi:hypothetical protein
VDQCHQIWIGEIRPDRYSIGKVQDHRLLFTLMGHKEEGVRLKWQRLLFQDHEILDGRIAGNGEVQDFIFFVWVPGIFLIQAIFQQRLETLVIGNAISHHERGAGQGNSISARRGNFLVILIAHPPAIDT